MISLVDLQKKLGYHKTQKVEGDPICFDEQEAKIIVSIITCLKNHPIISAEDAQVITRYDMVIKQVLVCLKKVSEVSFQGKSEVIFFFNNLLPITRKILMCLGFEVLDIPAKKISIKWWYSSKQRLSTKSLIWSLFQTRGHSFWFNM